MRLTDNIQCPVSGYLHRTQDLLGGKTRRSLGAHMCSAEIFFFWGRGRGTMVFLLVRCEPTTLCGASGSPPNIACDVRTMAIVILVSGVLNAIYSATPLPFLHPLERTDPHISCLQDHQNTGNMACEAALFVSLHSLQCSGRVSQRFRSALLSFTRDAWPKLQTSLWS